MPDHTQRLTEAISTLVDDAASHGAELTHDEAVAAFAVPHLRLINMAAAAAARANGYLHRVDDEADSGPVEHRWGRTLTVHTMANFGISGVLRNPPVPDRLAGELAGYLSGPPITGEYLTVLDADLPVAGSHQIAGWILSQIVEGELDGLVPLPSAATFARNPWDDALRHGGCTVLRQDAPSLEPSVGSFLPRWLVEDLFAPYRAIIAWKPLLLLNIAQPERVLAAAEYEIEPGRVVDRVHGDGLGMVENGNGVDEWEEPGWGPCRPDPDELAEILQVAEKLSARLMLWPDPPDGGKKARQHPSNRLRRAAHQFLATVSRLGADRDVLHQRNRAEVIFGYVAALEHLMTGAGEGHSDLGRKVAQRTAVLIGRSDEDRLQIRQAIADAYGIRSSVAHGDDPDERHLPTLPRQLHAYLQQVLRDLIILGPDFAVDKSCDDALLSVAIREKAITGPVGEAVAGLPASARWIRADVSIRGRARLRRRVPRDRR
ncbi:hypothetical protein ACGFJ7_35680 [Actinoplanes sp. NPDC048988]|uniref:hypothetical protein n=1 Tax=Actinoplanes sp. NPDC048988 TaxID=3363901 RepID=UPI0037108702